MSGADLSRGVLLDDRYRLQDVIGQGGMATVYRAQDTVLGRDVAIKLFPSAGEDDDVARHRVEMRILAQLSHPGLVTLHDAGSARVGGPYAQTYLVMELVHGPTLADRLSRGPVGPTHTARLGRQMAEALSVVHEAGVVHRDLKPANVLLVRDVDVVGDPDETGDALTTGPVVKLADFGIARLYDGARLTATGITLGTATYLSPEQAVGGPVGPPTDVYALGLVLLECLTGRKAFTGTVTEVAVARLNTSPTIPTELGPRWAAVLSGMVEREPADRLSSAEAAIALGEIADAPGANEATGHAWVVAGDLLADRSPEVPEATQRWGSIAGEWAARRLSLRVRPSFDPNGRPGRGRRRSIVAAGAIVVLTSVVLIATQLDRTTDAVAEPPAYPSVEGTLGATLHELQRSVQP